MASTEARVRTDPRLSRRRRAVERWRRRRLYGRLALVASLAVVLYAAFWSPLLHVRAIKVVGGRHTTAADVAAAAALDSSDNLLLLSTREVAARAADLPWVKNARVERKLPGTVKVTVEERRPAVVLSVAARRWTLDARGRVLERGATSTSLPVLTTTEGAELRPGSRVVDGPASAALAALRSLSRPLRRSVLAAFAPTRERISFSLESGLVVRFGAAERLQAKDRVLRAVLRQLHAEGASATYVDVRVPESPAVSSLPPPEEGFPDSGDEPATPRR
jgi:cell division protein FtsQ